MATSVKYKNKGLTGLWESLVYNYSGITAVVDKYNGIKLTYKDLYKMIQHFATGLQSLGLKKGQHICLFSENSAKWLIADQGILMCGAANAVRGSQAPVDELLYILDHSDSVALIAEDLATIEKLKDYPVNFIVCLSDELIPRDLAREHKVYSFSEVISTGKQHVFFPVDVEENDLATLVYTSGTTGRPRGVMLNHGNLLSQVAALRESLPCSTGEISLNILPTWHMYERTCEYYLLSKGITMAYTSVTRFKEDIGVYNPHYIISVPRIWESIYTSAQKQIRKQPLLVRLLGKNLIYTKIKDSLGKNFRLGISGGSALAGHLEDFFAKVGINIVVGYGLTETSPVLTLRRQSHNLKKSAGKPITGTEIKIVDGVVFARGAQVMMGYYNDPEATAEILSDDGWLNTGDTGWLTPENDLFLTGRSKDVIVLSNGENIEPAPIEDAILKSPYISQVMLVGQDKAHLGALIVPSDEALSESDINKTIRKELKRLIQNRANYRGFEQVQCFKILNEPFSKENGLLTQTMKIRKSEVAKKYRRELEEMFSH